MATVTQWLDAAEIPYTPRGVSNLDVTAPVAVLERLLATKFHVAVHAATERALVKAGDYAVPDQVGAAIATIFGLHGLPVPRPSEELGQPGEPADVTPAVIYSTYNVVSPKVTRSAKNRQAVAEFQGQFMNSTDLVNMFKRYVKDYKVGVDDVITNHHGAFEESSGGIEAELDIQVGWPVTICPCRRRPPAALPRHTRVLDSPYLPLPPPSSRRVAPTCPCP